jgi:hypothetical protein
MGGTKKGAPGARGRGWDPTSVPSASHKHTSPTGGRNARHEGGEHAAGRGRERGCVSAIFGAQLVCFCRRGPPAIHSPGCRQPEQRGGSYRRERARACVGGCLGPATCGLAEGGEMDGVPVSASGSLQLKTGVLNLTGPTGEVVRGGSLHLHLHTRAVQNQPGPRRIRMHTHTHTCVWGKAWEAKN